MTVVPDALNAHFKLFLKRGGRGHSLKSSLKQRRSRGQGAPHVAHADVAAASSRPITIAGREADVQETRRGSQR